jgi:putative flippase GtrA
MLSKRDLVAVTAIGAEVGILFQPIILNLWSDIATGMESAAGFVPPQWAVHAGAFVGFTVLAPLALSILYLLSRKIAIFYQIGKFAAVGSSNAFVDIGLLNLISLFVLLDKASLEFKAVAAGTAFVATVNSFLWNKFWAFEAGKSAEKPLMELVKFYAVTGFSALVNGTVTGIVASLVLDSGMSDGLATNIGKLGGIFSALAFNFLGYKFIVFKKPNVPPAGVPAA